MTSVFYIYFSMFGNIFNFSTFRSLQTFIASKHVDVLVTSTEKFYNLVQDFPIVRVRFEKSYENYTVSMNLSKTTLNNLHAYS